MSKVLTTLGASVVALGALFGGVEARTVFYEINGQRYSYDTNNRQQTAAARKQIEAAKIAEAATAQAAAERASNPLVAIFGSQTQREAAAAQAQLQQIIAEQEVAAGKRQRAVQATKDESAAQPANGQAGETASVKERESAAVAAIAATQPPAVHPIAQDLRDPADPARPEGLSRAAIRLISLDAETGIKTVIRVDGSIHEELFDPSVLSTLDPASRSVGSTRKAIGANQSPKVLPDETTGSTNVRELALGRYAGADPRSRPLSN
jgi:NADH dehydrogenase/NADH:ubiquinone oxidoreductase subunit G